MAESPPFNHYLSEVINQFGSINFLINNQGQILEIDGQAPPPHFPDSNFFSTLNEYEQEELERQRLQLNADPHHSRTITITTLRPSSAIKWNLAPNYDPDSGHYLNYAVTGMKIDEIFYKATHDTLTGLYNHNYLQDLLSRLNSSRQPIALIFVDVDKLKETNDSRGHAAGDQYLIQISQFLNSSFRPYDTIGRYGGDEFVAILESVDDATAQVIFDRLLLSLENYNQHHPDSQIQFSAGFSVWSPGQNIFDTLKSADSKMYAAKSQRKAARS